MNGRESTNRRNSLLWLVLKQMKWSEVMLTVAAAVAMVALVGLAMHLTWCGATGRLAQAEDVNYCGELMAEDCLVNTGLLLDPGAPGTVQARAFFRGDEIPLEDPQTEMKFPVNRDWVDDIYQIECSVSVKELEHLNSLAEMLALSPMTASDRVYLRQVGVTDVGNFYIWVETSLVGKALEKARAEQVETCALLAVGSPDKALQSGLVQFERRAIAGWQNSGHNPDTAVFVYFGAWLGLAWMIFAAWKACVYYTAKERYIIALSRKMPE